MILNFMVDANYFREKTEALIKEGLPRKEAAYETFKGYDKRLEVLLADCRPETRDLVKRLNRWSGGLKLRLLRKT